MSSLARLLSAARAVHAPSLSPSFFPPVCPAIDGLFFFWAATPRWVELFEGRISLSPFFFSAMEKLFLPPRQLPAAWLTPSPPSFFLPPLHNTKGTRPQLDFENRKCMVFLLFFSSPPPWEGDEPLSPCPEERGGPLRKKFSVFLFSFFELKKAFFFSPPFLPIKGIVPPPNPCRKRFFPFFFFFPPPPPGGSSSPPPLRGPNSSLLKMSRKFFPLSFPSFLRQGKFFFFSPPLRIDELFPDSTFCKAPLPPSGRVFPLSIQLLGPRRVRVLTQRIASPPPFPLSFSLPIEELTYIDPLFPSPSFESLYFENPDIPRSKTM